MRCQAKMVAYRLAATQGVEGSIALLAHVAQGSLDTAAATQVVEGALAAQGLQGGDTKCGMANMGLLVWGMCGGGWLRTAAAGRRERTFWGGQSMAMVATATDASAYAAAASSPYAPAARPALVLS